MTSIQAKNHHGGSDYLFTCDHAGCNKSFKRADHLTRHKRNHMGTDLYTCTWQGCQKSFVRKDVREKHMQRHLIKQKKQEDEENHGKIQFFEVYTPNSLGELNGSKNTASIKKTTNKANDPKFRSQSYSEGDTKKKLNYLDDGISEPKTKRYKRNQQENENNDSNKRINKIGVWELVNNEREKNNEKADGSYFIAEDLSPNTDYNLIGGRVVHSSLQLNPKEYPEIDFQNLSTTDLLDSDETSSELYNWVLENNTANSNTLEHAFDYSPSMLRDMLDTNFVFSTSQSSMTEEMRMKMIDIIPALRFKKYFEAPYLEKFLKAYWELYHIQFPILHRPSFSTSEAHPLLLLSMLTIGAALIRESNLANTKEYRKLAEDIAEPLRWLIFSASEFTPNITPWVMQSLLILESYETNCSNRRLHRRAHLHHGLKIQLLRRSPLLGGDPLGSSNKDKAMSGDTKIWANWIERESLKRCVFMTFLLDTLHSIIFGREEILSAHQIKLSLPCDDSLWEMDQIDKFSSEPQIETPKFLEALGKIIRKEKVETNTFGKKILLAGLLTIMFQMEQRDMEIKALKWNFMKSNWKETIFSSMDVWMDNSCGLNNWDSDMLLTSGLTDYKENEILHLCHISQAFLRIKQYDCIIFAGSPFRMNVKTNYSDYEIVKERIQEWASSFSGKISLAHAYTMILEVLINKNDVTMKNIKLYDPDSDLVFYRPNIVASMLFLIWGYNYCLGGCESNFFSRLETNSEERGESNLDTDLILSISNSCIPEKISGFNYIKKINYCYQKCLVNAKLKSHAIELFARILDQIPDKHCSVGLLRMFKDKYTNSCNQIFREYGKLMGNCIQRSLGKKGIICEGMYEE